MVVGWQECKLGDLLEIKHGYAFQGEYFADAGTHIVLTPGNFFDEGGFKHKGDKEKWYTGLVPTDYILKEGDLIVAMTEQAEGLLGSSAIVPRSGLYLHNQRLGLVQVRDELQTDKRFLYYLFNSRPVRQQIRASASGTKIRHTAPSRITEAKVSVPPLSTQRRIAGILSAYDDLIKNNQRRIRILEEMTRTLYREWFVHFRFPSREHTRMLDSPLGRVPEGWYRKLGDILKLKRGYDLPERDRVEGNVPIVSSSGVTGMHNVAKVKGPGVVTGRYGTLGEVFYVQEDFWPLNTTLYVEDFKGNEPILVMQLLQSLNLEQQNAAGAVPGVNRNFLHMLDVIFPPAGFQKRIAPTFENIVRFHRKLGQVNQKLQAARDLLLPRLLSGQITLEVAEASDKAA